LKQKGYFWLFDPYMLWLKKKTKKTGSIFGYLTPTVTSYL